MKGREVILVAAGTAALTTGLILRFAVPRLVDRAGRKTLAVSAAVMSEALNAMARMIEDQAKVVPTQTSHTATWPIPKAALNYVN